MMLSDLSHLCACTHTYIHRTIEAVEEDSSIFKKTKNLLKEADKSQRSGVSSIPVTSSPSPTMNRQDSYKLLWEELSKESLTSRESLCRTIQGVAVLRARQVLACVLRMWPNGGTKLGTTTLGCADIIHYFCLLDLLMHQQTKKEKEMVGGAGSCMPSRSGLVEFSRNSMVSAMHSLVTDLALIPISDIIVGVEKETMIPSNLFFSFSCESPCEQLCVNHFNVLFTPIAVSMSLLTPDLVVVYPISCLCIVVYSSCLCIGMVVYPSRSCLCIVIVVYPKRSCLCIVIVVYPRSCLCIVVVVYPRSCLCIVIVVYPRSCLCIIIVVYPRSCLCIIVYSSCLCISMVVYPSRSCLYPSRSCLCIVYPSRSYLCIVIVYQ